VPKCAHIFIKMLQVHNILLKMCNLSNILKTANKIFLKHFPIAIWQLSINVLSHYNAFELYAPLQSYRRKKHKSTYRSNEKQDAKVI